MVVPIAYGGNAAIQVSFTNTSGSSKTFYVGCSIAPSGGVAVDAPIQTITLNPNQSATPMFTFTGLSIKGLWGIRCSVWKVKPPAPEENRIADTGWLSGVINVEAPPEYPKTISRSPYSIDARNASEEGLLKDFLGIDPSGLDVDTWLSRRTKSEILNWYNYWVSKFDGAGMRTTIEKSTGLPLLGTPSFLRNLYNKYYPIAPI